MATFDAASGEAKDSFTLHTIGTLTIAGKENSLSMDVTATRMPDGTVKATGVVPIKMTDYGVKPPTAIFGRLKTGDEVKVNFELTVGAKAIATALPVFARSPMLAIAMLQNSDRILSVKLRGTSTAVPERTPEKLITFSRFARLNTSACT